MGLPPQRSVYHSLHFLHRQLSHLLPRPIPILLQPLPNHRLRARNHVPPRLPRNSSNRRIRRWVIAHLQQHALLLLVVHHDANHVAHRPLRLGLGREVRNRGDDDGGLGQRQRMRHRPDRHEAVAEARGLALADHRGDLAGVPVDEVDRVALHPLHERVDGCAARSSAADDAGGAALQRRVLLGRDVLADALSDANAVRVRADQRAAAVRSLFQEDGVEGPDGGALGGELVQVWDDGYLVRHCDGGAEELGVAREGDEGGDGEGFMEELGPVQGEGVVYGLVEERGERVRDGMPKEVGYAVQVVGVVLRRVVN